jgi:signal transduction histidine kinase
MYLNQGKKTENKCIFLSSAAWLNNGVGFDTSFTRKVLELKNMANRAGLFDGKFDIRSKPGAGCIVKVTLPLK